MIQKTPITTISLRNREFFIKRDDLIDPYLAGNKYRKLYTLLQTPKEAIKKVISYGGTQSNAMVAIASMAHKKGWEFTYYTKPLSHTQKTQSIGNFADALAFGMQHIEIDTTLYKDFIASLRLNLEEKTIIIDQGGANQMAREGVMQLAKEIRKDFTPHMLDAIATPAGTGTTALYLASLLPEYKVYTTPSIGDKHYLQTQMQALAPLPKNLIILEPSKKYHFAKLYPEFFLMYKELLQTNIEFDLLYAPLLWINLLEQTNKEEKILYIHSGGVSGNQTMLERYRKKEYFSL